VIGIWAVFFRAHAVVLAPSDEVKGEEWEDASLFGESEVREFAASTGKPIHVNPVISVQGRFPRGTQLEARFYAVRSGTIEKCISCGLGPGGLIRHIPPMRITIHLFFLETEARKGTIVALGATGFRRGTGSGKLSIPWHGERACSQVVPGSISKSQERIAYVEGTVMPTVNSSMSVEEFAEANDGDFLVITVQIDEFDE